MNWIYFTKETKPNLLSSTIRFRFKFQPHQTFKKSLLLQPPMTEKDKEEIYSLKMCKRTQKSITPMNYFMKNKDFVPG